MPTPTVTILDDGQMQVSVDGMQWAPLPLAAVQALAARVGDAQAATQRQTLTAATRGLLDILVASGPAMAATVTVTATALDATVDDDSFDRAVTALNAAPNGDGSITSGPVTIRRTDPLPVPPPPAAPSPTETSNP